MIKRSWKAVKNYAYLQFMQRVNVENFSAIDHDTSWYIKIIKNDLSSIIIFKQNLKVYLHFNN